jgi:hypothetical protein
VGTPRGAAVLAVVVLVASLSACSKKSDEPTSHPGSSSGPASTTDGLSQVASADVMVDGHTHTISGAIDCSTSASNPSATPTQAGTETTSISAQDDSAWINLSLSNATPPSVDGFSLSLTVENGEYSIPFQKPQKPVEATKQGKSYAVKGTGSGWSTPGRVGRALPFEIHVTCP